MPPSREPSSVTAPAAPEARVREGGRKDSPAAEWSPIEAEVAELWGELLGARPTGPNQAFFDVGGNSLQAMALLGRLQDRFGLTLPARLAVANPTVPAIAQALAAAAEVLAAKPILHDPRLGPAPVSVEQGRQWLLAKLLPAPGIVNLSYAWKLRGLRDLERLEEAWRRVVERHEILRTSLVEAEGGLRQVAADTVPPSWTFFRHDLRTVPPEEREDRAGALLADAARQPFDLSQAPPWRVHAVRLEPELWLLAFTLHPVAIDDWSWRVIVRELEVAWNGGAPAPARALQYSDYARWQNAVLARASTEAERRFWRRELADAPSTLGPHSAGPMGAVREAGWLEVRTPVPVRAAVERFAQGTGSDPFLVALAALQATLAGWAGSGDVVIGVAAANRERTELRTVVGPLQSLVPLRLPVEPGTGFHERVRRVAELTGQAMAHAGLPFGEIVRQAPGAADPRRPVFRALFLLRAEEAPLPALTGVEVERACLAGLPAERDLTLTLVDDGQGGWLARWQYARDLLEPATVARLAGQFATFLAGVAGLGQAEVESAPAAARGSPVSGGEAPAPPSGAVLPPQHGARMVIPPRDATEEMLVSLWREVLRVGEVSVTDGFFELGGHSLTAIRMLQRLRRETGVEIGLRALFDQPRLESLASRLREAGQGVRPAEAPGRTTSSRPRVAPASPGQRSFWLASQLQPGTATDQVSSGWWLRGRIDRDRLERAIGRILQRHEVLRNTLAYRTGGLEQETADFNGLTLEVLEPGGADAAARTASAEAMAAEWLAAPYDLERGPLFRAALSPVAPDLHLFLVGMHHAVSDLWSLALFRAELSEIYAAAEEGREPRLPQLPVQYGDYARWQAERLERLITAPAVAYWRERLDGAPATLDWAGGTPTGPEADSVASGFEDCRIPASVAAGLAAVARAENASPFMALLAGFQALLGRMAGVDDLVVGATVADRQAVETQGLIGLFLNTLPIRCDLSGGPSFRELVRRVRDRTFEAFEHAEIPFERLVQELKPARETARHPIFQVLVNYLEDIGPPLRFPGIETTPHQEFPPGSMYDLTLYLTPGRAGVQSRILYRTALFPAARVRLLLQQYVRLLEQAAANPELPINALPLDTEAERGRLPDPRAALPAAVYDSVSLRFSRWTALRPEAVALEQAGRQWSYARLDGAARELARELRAAGAGPGAVVAIGGRSSPGLIASLLAVWRVGGVVLTLDPALPPARRRLMMESARAGFLLQAGPPAGAGSPPPGLRVIPVPLEPADSGDAGPLSGAAPGPADEPAGAPADAAYIFFTSGTSGAPKAVVGTHAGLAHFLDWQQRTFEIGPGDRVPQLTGLSFDVVLRDIFLPLVSGGALVLPESDAAATADDTLRWLDRAGVTVLHVTPSVAQSWLAAGAPAAVPASLRLVFFAGEPLPGALVDRWREAFPGRILNLYGPTETTLAKCCFEPPSPADRGVQAVGFPLPQTQVWVLNAAGAPAAIGEPGEICLRTPFRTQGYLADPEETGRRFVPNPFRDDPADLVYRTGDRGRFRADGALEICGRLDDQVKIRGVRIEPAEVNAVLGRHPLVRASAVVARRDAEGRTQLAAYVVPATPGGADPAPELRRHLAESLPAAMIPAAFVAMASLPLTANGKIDHRALPEPDVLRAPQAQYVAPRTPAEVMVAKVWAEALKRASPGVHDNFFELGGHSLLALQVVNRLGRIFGRAVPVRGLFHHPTVEGLARELELAEAGRPAGPGPLPEDRAPARELSPAQMRLWFLDQYDPGSAAYNIPVGLRLRGSLDAGRLAAAITAVITRHEVLRSAFPAEEGRPRVVVAPAAPFALPVASVESAPAEGRETAARRLAEAEVRRPFDLARGPLVRALLIRLAPEEHWLVLTQHHIVSDGWSVEVFLRELAAFHGDGPGTAPPALRLQYSEWAGWERSRLTGALLDEQLSYWRRTLAGAPALLELPLDHRRPAVAGDRGDAVAATLPPELTAALDRLAAEHGATRFMLLLAAFQALLHRYSRQDDIVVGFPVAGRSHPLSEPLIGLFINTLPLRTSFAGEPSFAELLGRVRQGVLDALAHQDLPFERLVDELNTPRSTSHSPVFQALFLFKDDGAGPPQLAGLETSFLELHTGTAKTDLTLHVTAQSGGWRAELNFSTELFGRETIRELLAHWMTLLRSLVAEPLLPVALLPLVGEAELARLDAFAAGPAVAYPRDQTLAGLFAEQAARTPAAAALVYGDEVVSYRELAARADRIAQVLRRAGVGPDAPVAVCLGRTPDLVAALLAVHQAGGAYVPLDPEYPTDRLAFMLADSCATVLLTERRFKDRVPAPGAKVVLLEELGAEAAAEPISGPVAGPHHLAYIMYTSGSTGRPKGVAVEHRGVVSLVHWARTVFSAEDLAGVFFSTSICFDLSVFEIFITLGSGGALVLARNVLDLHQLAGPRPVTLIDTVPSALRALTAIAPLPPSVRVVVSGGEPLPARLVDEIFAAGFGGRLYDLYGPTETTVYSAGGLRRPGEPPTIGRPLGNTCIRLLDPHGRPTPRGCVGELHIGGDGLARGYWRRPELTSERFAPDPADPAGRARLYRTGDLARWTPEGRLVFLGRSDNQVKLRGFRIELGEVEAALLRIPTVAEAVAVVRERADGDARLLAYVAPRPGAMIDPEGVRTALQRELPGYMTPGAVVVLPRLPLTANNKVDRAALPTPDPAGSGDGSVAPRTELESQLSRIWAEVLDIPAPGVNQNFFELGGHSLLALRVESRLKGALGRPIPLRLLFEHPTIESLARALQAAPPEPPGMETEPLQPGGEAARELSPAQMRLWFLDQYEPGSAAYNIPLALRLRGAADPERLQGALTAIANRHEALRSSFPAEDGQPRVVVAPPGPVPMPVTSLEGSPASERTEAARALAEAEVRRPFDLARGPLLRALLIRLGPEEHWLVVTQHHIISDGWSIEVFFRELAAFYRDGTRAALPALAVQYADWAGWERRRLSGGLLARQVGYWRRALAGAPALLEPPLDHPRPLVAGSAGATVSAVVPAGLAQTLDRLAREHEATRFMLLLGSFQALLHRYTRQEDIVIGSPVAGRSHPAAEPLIGFFANTLALRTSFADEPSLAELLPRVRRTVLEALAHQDLPLERLVEELMAPRSTSHHPVFQALFTLEQSAPPPSDLGGVEATFLRLDTAAAKMDLALHIAPGAEGWLAELTFRTDLFQRETMRCFLQHWVALLRGAAASPSWATPTAPACPFSPWAAPPSTRGTRRSPRPSPPKRPARRTPPPWCTARDRCPTGRSTPLPAASPAASGRWARISPPPWACTSSAPSNT